MLPDALASGWLLEQITAILASLQLPSEVRNRIALVLARLFDDVPVNQLLRRETCLARRLRALLSSRGLMPSWMVMWSPAKIWTVACWHTGAFVSFFIA
ncbi:hypothetical protein [Corynebacterium pseudotuberculosis]|uniref:hypothetical protein n=1 Tax=Corynebacterium pseudotuberculosis TaxID=1719 RepID=UPI00065DC17A|nr:hypothetical protein [Corynebacterium pseudotuberculosis]